MLEVLHRRLLPTPAQLVLGVHRPPPPPTTLKDAGGRARGHLFRCGRRGQLWITRASLSLPLAFMNGGLRPGGRAADGHRNRTARTAVVSLPRCRATQRGRTGAARCERAREPSGWLGE